MHNSLKILIVSSGNSGAILPFVKEQGDSLVKLGVSVGYFTIIGKGIIGYLKNYFELISTIKANKPNLIHAHFGLSGLLSIMQRIVPVVITFHGCDVNDKKTRVFSKVASKLSKENIFVSRNMLNNMYCRSYHVIPCGVNLEMFKKIDKTSARDMLGMSRNKKYVLFSSDFNNVVKNYPLASSALERLNDPNVELVELKGYSREEVVLLLNAVDVVLLTSFREGSPQIIKEAVACGTPVVTTNVGDVKDILDGDNGSYITKFDEVEISMRIKDIIDNNVINDKYIKIQNYDNMKLSMQVMNVYKAMINK